MYSISRFNLNVAKFNSDALKFEAIIKEYCAASKKQFYAVMNTLVNHDGEFSVIELRHNSYNADITLNNLKTGVIRISENSINIF